MSEEGKRPIGRPTDYKPEYCQMLVDFMKETGGSIEEFASHIGFSKQCIYEWFAKHKDFGDAKALAVTHAQAYWEAQGRKGLWNVNHGKGEGSITLNNTIWVFAMKNRFGWRDKAKEEMKDEKEVAVEIAKAAAAPVDPLAVLEKALKDPFLREELKKKINES